MPVDVWDGLRDEAPDVIRKPKDGRPSTRSDCPTMGLFDITDLALERGLQGASLRQQVLSNNLANANTAGFKRSDVDFHSSLSAALESGDESSALAGMSFSPVADTQSTMRADGNNVDFDQEMANLTENALDYETLLSIHRARVEMLKAAMGGGS